MPRQANRATIGAVFQIISLLALFAALAAGAVLSRLTPRIAVRGAQLLLNGVLYALILTMGYRIGWNPEVTSRLGEVGVIAATHAAACVAGTAVVLVILLALLHRRRIVPVASPRGSMGGGRGVAVLLRDPAVLLLVLAAGIVLGRVLAPHTTATGETPATIVLHLLMFLVGYVFARCGVRVREVITHPLFFLIPAGTVVGSLLGGAAACLFPSIRLAEALALSSAFGWYSLSGVVLTRISGPVLGAVAFLSNMMREAIAILLIPLLARTAVAYAGVGIAGATSMDVTLPLLQRFCGPEVVPFALASGVLLSLLVPVLVPFFAYMV